MNKAKINHFIFMHILVSLVLFLTLEGCGGCGNNDRDSKRTKEPRSNYTHRAGGNKYSKPKLKPEKLTDLIQVKIVEHTVIINDRKFNNIDDSVEYVYNLKKTNDRLVFIDFNDSKAKTVAQFKVGLDQKGIDYKRKGE